MLSFRKNNTSAVTVFGSDTDQNINIIYYLRSGHGPFADAIGELLIFKMSLNRRTIGLSFPIQPLSKGEHDLNGFKLLTGEKCVCVCVCVWLSGYDVLELLASTPWRN